MNFIGLGGGNYSSEGANIYILAPSLFTLLKIKPIKSKFAFYILHYYKFYGI